MIKKFALAFLTICLIQINGVFGKIIEAPHFSDLLKHIDEDSWIILDIDDTLLIPAQMLGSDIWFEHRIQAHLNQGMDANNALEQSLAEWLAVRHMTKMVLVEPTTADIVYSLQKQGCCVMGLTTQGLSLATRTIFQLNENNINLHLSPPDTEDYYFCLSERGVLYRHGVLFTSGTSKGESFFQLCQQMRKKPKRIVFINDKHTHLRDLEITAELHDVEFIGLRYAYSDSKKKTFDPTLAHFQWTHSTFANILSDEAVCNLLLQETEPNLVSHKL